MLPSEANAVKMLLGVSLMRGISWLSACNAAVAIRSHRFATRAAPLTVVSWLVSPRAVRRGGLSMIAVAVVVLSAQPAALASSATAPDWTQQSPAAHPDAREYASMAYDAATGNIVLFGGEDSHGRLSGTWTWDGSTWTKQAPATRPPPRVGASMAYDAATGNIVLFGGNGNHRILSDTWTWDGSTWTKQSPPTHPSARAGASMAYDAATRDILLFGGFGRRAATWTWDGSTWTKQSPATSPHGRENASMAYDAATGNIVLFGGDSFSGLYRDTWTWDGSTWTKQSPATHPSARHGASMAYDRATRNIVLFGGFGFGNDGMLGYLSATWTWDGSTWTKQVTTASPLPRWLASMAYDAAAGNIVLFGGGSSHGYLSDTWTWGGTG